MLGSVWSGFGGKAAERWASLLVSPALAFWGAGLLAWVHARGGLTGRGWVALEAAWKAGPGASSVVAQACAVLGVLLLVATSTRLSESTTEPLIRTMEGYWPAVATPIRLLVMVVRSWHADRRTARWRALATARADLTGGDHRAYLRLTAWRGTQPADPADRMPTRLGNVLRAAETRPRHRYGLEAVVCWPHLWLLLPEHVRAELSTARSRLDEHARLWSWGLLIAVWTVFTWWALPVALVATTIGYRLARSSATTYGQLVQASYDLHRKDLYEALGRELPDDPEAEALAGAELSRFLQRGPIRE
ncbi:MULTISPECIES: hypothetical protein [Actinosynnema]|uniref:hypothetical protein n=1 Tax=Actinosynnema TaxID=40566 RepID=UPI0020A2839F|nr:hypothetical protein [Actinosynnema pretiosum]MCP2094734.1 hypothetical protein [Actinosynnema pretiosum]